MSGRDVSARSEAQGQNCPKKAMNERDNELIQDFLSGRMSGAERSAFAARLESDAELRRAWVYEKALNEALNRFSGMTASPGFGDRLLAQVNGEQADAHIHSLDEARRRPIPMSRYWATAAGVVAVIALALMVVINGGNGTTPGNDDLAQVPNNNDEESDLLDLESYESDLSDPYSDEFLRGLIGDPEFSDPLLVEAMRLVDLGVQPDDVMLIDRALQLEVESLEEFNTDVMKNLGTTFVR